MSCPSRSDLDADRSETHLVASRRFVCEPKVGSAVRRFVAEQTADVASLVPSLDVELAATELVTNVVLHARTDFEVRLLRRDGVVRLEVQDGSSAVLRPGLLADTAMSGRGLMMVQALASRWGVEHLESGGKYVWCELGGEVDEAGGGEQLVQLWSGDLDEDDDRVGVTVEGLPVPELVAAKVHMEDLLRELQLALIGFTSGGSVPADREEVHLARRLVGAADEFSDGMGQVRSQAMEADAAGLRTMTLHLRLPPSAGAAARRYRDAVADAEQLPPGRFLVTADDLHHDAPVRHRYLDGVIAQLGATDPA